jgi:hypothetical protein
MKYNVPWFIFEFYCTEKAEHKGFVLIKAG